MEALLGFDGVTDTVNIHYERAAGDGDNTVFSGTAFIGDWLADNGAGGWQVRPAEQGLLDFIAEIPAEERAEPTAVVWLHSEYDSKDWTLTPERWASAVRHDAGLVRDAFDRDAGDLPYLFVSAIPYWGTDPGHQAIRVGMEALADDPGFNAAIAARAHDLDMSNDDVDGNGQTREYGGPHMSAGDAELLAGRIARALAQEWAEHAKPGSPVALAGGQVADLGPEVIAAAPAGPSQLLLTVAFDAASRLLPLDPDAAIGEGWSVRPAEGGTWRKATAVELVGVNQLRVTFDGPVEAGDLLHFGHGYGRLSGADGGGHGNAVYDDAGLPIWVQARGLPIGAPGEGGPGGDTDSGSIGDDADEDADEDADDDADDDADEGAADDDATGDGNGTGGGGTGDGDTAGDDAGDADDGTSAGDDTGDGDTDGGDTGGGAPTHPPLSLELGSGPDRLVLHIAQQAYQGPAEYTVAVNGTQLGGTLTASALLSAGEHDTLTLHGSWGAEPLSVTVTFLNDRWVDGVGDRNLYVTQSDYNGEAGPAPGTIGWRDSFALTGPATPPDQRPAVEGTEGEDRLLGAAGGDVIHGGAGDDTMRGGAGADGFHLAEGDGADRIHGFRPGVDVLVFEASAEDTVRIETEARGAWDGLLVRYGSGEDSVWLRGVTALEPGDMLCA